MMLAVVATGAPVWGGLVNPGSLVAGHFPRRIPDITAGVTTCPCQGVQVFRLLTHAPLYTTPDHHAVLEALAHGRS
jgi:hypothetical protein